MKNVLQKSVIGLLLVLATLMTSVLAILPVGAETASEARIGTQEYATLEEAVAAAASGDVIELLTDVELGASGEVGLVINKSLTINGHDKKITGTSRRMIQIYGGSTEAEKITVNFNDVYLYVNHDSNGVRCIDTRGGYMTVNFDGCKLEAVNETQPVPQPITVGGNHDYPIEINVKSSEIVAGYARDNDPQNPKYNAELGYAPARYGYAVIAFNPVKLSVENSKITAWCAVYLHSPMDSHGAEGSQVALKGCEVESINDYVGESNSFGAIVVAQSDCAVDVADTDFSLSTADEEDAPQNFVLLMNETATQTENVRIDVSGNTSVTGAAQGGLVLDVTASEGASSSNTVAISGGTFDVPVADEYCAPGYAVVAQPDGTFGAASYTSLKEEAIAQMDAMKASYYEASRYTEENKKKLEDHYTAAKEAIEAATTVEAINQTLAMFKINIYTVERIPLSTLREDAFKTLQLEKIALIEKNKYGEEQRKEIEAYQADAKKAIETATTPAEIDAICAQYAADIAKVETGGEEIAVKEAGKWYIPLIVIGSVILALIIAIVVLKLLKKQQAAAKRKAVREMIVAQASAVAEAAPATEEAPATEAEQEITQEPRAEAPVEEAPAAQEPVADAPVENDEKAALFASLPSASGKSHAERLEQADELTKAFCTQIKEELLSYKGVKSRLSQKGDSFRQGRKLLAKITVTGKTVKCYLALDPAAYDVKRYRHTDVSARKAYAAVPMLLRVRSKLAAKRACQLIAELAQQNGLVKK